MAATLSAGTRAILRYTVYDCSNASSSTQPLVSSRCSWRSAYRGRGRSGGRRRRSATSLARS